MLEGVDQEMITVAVGVEPGVVDRPKLSEQTLPLLLVVNGVPQDDMSHLVSGPHQRSSGLISPSVTVNTTKSLIAYAVREYR